jgi:hypothetical protein
MTTAGTRTFTCPNCGGSFQSEALMSTHYIVNGYA